MRMAERGAPHSSALPVKKSLHNIKKLKYKNIMIREGGSWRGWRLDRWSGWPSSTSPTPSQLTNRKHAQKANAGLLRTGTRNLWCTWSDSIRYGAGYKGIPVILTEYKIDEKTSTSPTLSQLTNRKHAQKANAKEGLLRTRNLWRNMSRLYKKRCRVQRKNLVGTCYYNWI